MPENTMNRLNRQRSSSCGGNNAELSPHQSSSTGRPHPQSSRRFPTLEPLTRRFGSMPSWSRIRPSYTFRKQRSLSLPNCALPISGMVNLNDFNYPTTPTTPTSQMEEEEGYGDILVVEILSGNKALTESVRVNVSLPGTERATTVHADSTHINAAFTFWSAKMDDLSYLTLQVRTRKGHLLLDSSLRVPFSSETTQHTVGNDLFQLQLRRIPLFSVNELLAAQDLCSRKEPLGPLNNTSSGHLLPCIWQDAIVKFNPPIIRKQICSIDNMCHIANNIKSKIFQPKSSHIL